MSTAGAKYFSLMEDLQFQIFADHASNILTVLLRGTEHQTRVHWDDFSHQSNDVIWIDFMHRTRVLKLERSDIMLSTLAPFYTFATGLLL